MNKLINRLPIDIHLHRSKLQNRLNGDGTQKARSIPINLVNQAAYHHDLYCAKHEYTDAHNSICDNDMLASLDIQNYKMRERVDRNIANPLIGTKVQLGLGERLVGHIN